MGEGCKCESESVGGCCSKGGNLGMLFLVVVLAAIIGSGIFFYASNSSVQKQMVISSGVYEKSTLSINGNAKTSVEPDTAEMSVSVTTQETTAVDAQSKNANKTAAVRAALKTAGLADDEVTTSYFYTEPVYEGSYVCPADAPKCASSDKVWKSELVGYKTVHSLSVKTQKLDSVGKIVDAAVNAGSDTIGSISFTLSDAKTKTINSQLLVEAILDAKSQADKMATAAEVKLLKPLTISQGYYSTPYSYSSYEKSVGAAMDSSIPTTITSGKIDLSASVSMLYEVE
ncbi:MAG: SIMPL domain-containing protein [Candidatus Micrarchaeia archaeon]|jgi:hypothetical protein